MPYSFGPESAYIAPYVPISEEIDAPVDVAIRVTKVLANLPHIHMAGKCLLGYFPVMLVKIFQLRNGTSPVVTLSN